MITYLQTTGKLQAGETDAANTFFPTNKQTRVQVGVSANRETMLEFAVAVTDANAIAVAFTNVFAVTNATWTATETAIRVAIT